MPNIQDKPDSAKAPPAERIAKVRARLAHLRADTSNQDVVWPRDLNTQPSSEPNDWDAHTKEPRHG